jgi:hypothetical protein
MSLSAAFIPVVMIWPSTPLPIKWSALGCAYHFDLNASGGISTVARALKAR